MLQSRALGFWETFKAITHDFCHGFETICITTQVTGKIDISLLIKALEFTYHRHPLLQATINEKDDVYYYDFTNTFNDIPIELKTEVNEEILQRSFYNATNSSLEPQKYLWKVDISYEQDKAIFTLIIHHSPCDGRSMMNIVDDILYAYSCYLNQDTPKHQNLPLLPATEHLSIINHPLEDYLRQREELIAVTTEKDSIISIGPQQNLVPLEQRSTHIVYNELSEEQTKHVFNYCTKNKVTSNSFLNGLMLIVAQRVHETPLSLAMLTPVLTKTPFDKAQVGCHVSLVTTLYEEINAKPDIMTLAHDYQKKLKHEIQTQTNLPKEFTKMDVANAFGLNLALDFYKYQLVVSNLGVAHISKKYQNITVEKVLGGVNNRAGAVACILITYILHNKMQLGFVYTKPLVSEDYIERFTKEFMQLIHHEL